MILFKLKTELHMYFRQNHFFNESLDQNRNVVISGNPISEKQKAAEFSAALRYFKIKFIRCSFLCIHSPKS